MGLRSSREGSLEEAVLAVGWEWLLGWSGRRGCPPSPGGPCTPWGPEGPAAAP